MVIQILESDSSGSVHNELLRLRGPELDACREWSSRARGEINGSAARESNRRALQRWQQIAPWRRHEAAKWMDEASRQKRVDSSGEPASQVASRREKRRRSGDRIRLLKQGASGEVEGGQQREKKKEAARANGEKERSLATHYRN